MKYLKLVEGTIIECDGERHTLENSRLLKDGFRPWYYRCHQNHSARWRDTREEAEELYCKTFNGQGEKT